MNPNQARIQDSTGTNPPGEKFTELMDKKFPKNCAPLGSTTTYAALFSVSNLESEFKV